MSMIPILRSLTSFKSIYQKLKVLLQQPWAQIILLLVFCSVLFILGVGRWDLWNPDEPRYAQVAKEMVERGDWILMHVNGEIYVDKPPLFFWLIALSSFLWQGFTSFSARFPSAFLSTLTVLLTFFLGKKLYGSRTGFLSAVSWLQVLNSPIYPPGPISMPPSLSLPRLRLFFFSCNGTHMARGRGVGRKIREVFPSMGFIPAWDSPLCEGARWVYPSPFGQSGLSPRVEGLESNEEDEAGDRDGFTRCNCLILVSSSCLERGTRPSSTKPCFIRPLNALQKGRAMSGLSTIISPISPSTFCPGSFFFQEPSFTVSRKEEKGPGKIFSFFWSGSL